jgi:hypothetical protein
LDASRPLEAIRDALSLLAKWAKGRHALASLPPRLPPAASAPATCSPSLPDVPKDYYWSGGPVRRAARVTLGAVRRVEAAEIVRKRRENYQLLHRLLSEAKNISLLWDDGLDDPETCPLGLPVLVSNKSRWCDQLNASGIAVSPWWSGCHAGLNWSEYPEALDLKARLILLPVHQQLGTKHMQYIARKVQSFAKS